MFLLSEPALTLWNFDVWFIPNLQTKPQLYSKNNTTSAVCSACSGCWANKHSMFLYVYASGYDTSILCDICNMLDCLAACILRKKTWKYYYFDYITPNTNILFNIHNYVAIHFMKITSHKIIPTGQKLNKNIQNNTW